MLWRGKRVCYVGGENTLRAVMAKDAAYIYHIPAPKRDAYSSIELLETACVDVQADITIISLGAAGTALAARLAKRGIHALDLGLLGQFMSEEHQGAFAFKPEDLASPAYRDELKYQHDVTRWGGGGASWVEPVAAFAKQLEAADVLDYGCGQGTLAVALAKHGVKCKNYDPGRPEFAALPKIADVVVSTDNLEHIEPALIDNVLRHQFLLARKGAFLVVATKPAKKVLRDGRNAHLTCEEWPWWEARLRAAGWKNLRLVKNEWKKFIVECRK